jgi:hypothetical protein
MKVHQYIILFYAKARALGLEVSCIDNGIGVGVIRRDACWIALRAIVKRAAPATAREWGVMATMTATISGKVIVSLTPRFRIEAGRDDDLAILAEAVAALTALQTLHAWHKQQPATLEPSAWADVVDALELVEKVDGVAIWMAEGGHKKREAPPPWTERDEVGFGPGPDEVAVEAREVLNKGLAEPDKR